MTKVDIINTFFKKCFSNASMFEKAELTSDINAEITDLITKFIPNELIAIINNQQLIVKGSVGAGRATRTPWIAILDKDITTSTREGVYIVFLFSSDYKHVYLTLNQGTTVPGAFGPRLGKKEVSRKSQDIRELLNIDNELLCTDGNADIADEKYRAGAIYYTLWDVDNVDKGRDLLALYLNIYKQYKSLIKKTNVNVGIKTNFKMNTEIDIKYRSYVSAIKTKPFVLLAGISGTGKSRIVRKLAQATTTQKYDKDEDRWKDNRPENFELIQVKPNWHNSMDVVGFYSNISGKYEFTPFVEFVVKAWQHKDTPYFLCLDEMNLAPVEEYFAEFLSAIESRSTDENGEYITDPIIKPFKEFGQDACEKILKHLLGEAHHTKSNPLALQFSEKGLTLPPNLIVMGTVNMDETTFTFSRKVLDRAMSIEMNEVDFDKFLSGESAQFPLLTDVNELLVNRPQQASEVKDSIDSEKVINYLKDVNILLEGTPFKLGYRAANEAMLYVAASMDFAGNEFKLGTALDEFTLMKILSRIEGDDNRLAVDEQDERIKDIKGGILDKGEDRINLLNCLRAIVRKHIGAETATEQKINVMYRTLEREHFVSYWA